MSNSLLSPSCCLFTYWQVAKGQADATLLAQEQKKLGKMKQQLVNLEQEAQNTASRANSLWKFLGFDGGAAAKRESPTGSTAASPEGTGSSSSSGSRGSRTSGSKTGSKGATTGSGSEKAGSSRAGTTSGRGTTNVFAGLWETVGDQLFALEAQLTAQVSATEKQKVSVKNLRQQVASGQASADQLKQEEARLGEMSQQLTGLQSNYNSLWSQAKSVLRSVREGNTSSKRTDAKPGEKKIQAAVDEVESDSESGGTGGTALAKGASGMVYAGLKFSGLAMRIASQVVGAVKDDAQKMMKVRLVGSTLQLAQCW